LLDGLNHGLIILVRFDHFQESLGVAPNMLTHGLNCLTSARLLERAPYSERPLRDEYLLTETARDFRPVVARALSQQRAH
jgi:DNA-binding HxlR family transcriptional regulator